MMLSATGRDWASYTAAGGVMNQKAERAARWKVYCRLAVWAIAGFILLSFTSKFERATLALLMLVFSKIYSDSTAMTSFLATQSLWNLSYLRRVRPLRGREIEEYEQRSPWDPRDPSADDTGRPYDDKWLAHELSTIEADLVKAREEATVGRLLGWVEHFALVGILIYSCAQ